MVKHSAVINDRGNQNKKIKKKTTHKKKSQKQKSHKKPKKHVSSDENIENFDFEIDEMDDIEPENGSDNEYVEEQEMDDEYIDEVNEEEEDDEVEDDQVEVKPKRKKLDDKTVQRLKKKIVDWLDYDDKIKTLNAKSKKYKDAKKQQEELIIKMITKLEVEDMKIDVHDNENNFRSRVYRHKSVTKEALKEKIIKDALMEAIHDEKKVDQLCKKIESKRPVKERYYLKRTKGNKNE